MQLPQLLPQLPQDSGHQTPVKEIQWRVPDLRVLLLSSLTAGLPLLPALKGSCEESKPTRNKAAAQLGTL